MRTNDKQIKFLTTAGAPFLRNFLSTFCPFSGGPLKLGYRGETVDTLALSRETGSLGTGKERAPVGVCPFHFLPTHTHHHRAHMKIVRQSSVTVGVVAGSRSLVSRTYVS